MKFNGISDLSVARIADQMGDKRVAKIRKGAQSVYVGTYGKYNSGSLDGAWLDLEDYGSMEEFYEAARELHRDEEDPEFMFQDHEGLPEWAIGESWISPDYWELIDSIPDEDDREAFNAFVDNVYGGEIKDLSDAISAFEDAYAGQYDSMEDFAYEYLDDVGIESVGNIHFYFDEASFIRDLGYEGWSEVDEDDAMSDPDSYPDGPGVYDPSGEFYGPYDSLQEVVDGWMDEGIIGEETMRNYFDYEAFARDLSHDYYLIDGYLFRNY